MGKTGVIIALDNASYHKGSPDDTPKGTWSKARLVEASVSDYKTQIWDQVKRYVKEHVRPPIELLWAYVKGGVGRRYTVSTTFADVREQLDAAFNTIPSDVIYNCCIENSKTEVRRLDAYIRDECDFSDFDVDIDISPLDDDINTIA
ncbi:hypothetical protein ACHHYP_09717 [Achlya hypogyna]|uniref:Uncharacterized protein n=1 Tax=Achlya hypogyna TaxID=1202772 RepID=A0A1V9YMK3_ACHHY|nr:hypothetical protein ACHHYP_09717 [Achlya hypogyna]